MADLVASATAIAKAVPLPAVGLGHGATRSSRPIPFPTLLRAHGTAIQVDDPAVLDARIAATATMGAYFALADAIATWLGGQRVAAAESGIMPPPLRGFGCHRG